MGRKSISLAVAIALLGSASVIAAAPVLPVAGTSAVVAPVAGASVVGASARAGARHTAKSSELVPTLAIGLALLGVAAAAGGIAAATSGGHHSDQRVSP